MEDRSRDCDRCLNYDERVALQSLVALHAEELGVFKVVLEKLEKSLFGNGQPGIIDKFEARLSSLERRYWIAVGILGTLQFLTGNGVLSLKAVLGK